MTSMWPRLDGGERSPHSLALAEQHGIRAAEGVELLERLMASGRSRLIASSIDLDSLRAAIAPSPTEVAPTTPSPLRTRDLDRPA